MIFQKVVNNLSYCSAFVTDGNIQKIMMCSLRTKMTIHGCNDDGGNDHVSRGHLEVAYHYYNPTPDKKNIKEPAVLFCNGYRSSMYGNKALAIEDYCKKKSISFCRFDYRGHGESNPEDFLQLTLSEWIDDAKNILQNILLKNNDRIIIVGSSMGSWIALHLATLYPQNIVGIVGVASAVDFTEDIYNSATSIQKKDWENNGVAYFPSRYDSEPYPVTWNLICDAKQKWYLMDKSTNISITCPVRLLHGQCDEDIPCEKSLQLSSLLDSEDVILTLIKSGDHRLSTPQDLKRILDSVDELASNCKYSS
jgi:pimeloyl-ACP methyl ester carboxylesterase